MYMSKLTKAERRIERNRIKKLLDSIPAFTELDAEMSQYQEIHITCRQTVGAISKGAKHNNLHKPQIYQR
jgi:hypothetical protein